MAGDGTYANPQSYTQEQTAIHFLPPLPSCHLFALAPKPFNH
jgi:hypothetical protein